MAADSTAATVKKNKAISDDILILDSDSDAEIRSVSRRQAPKRMLVSQRNPPAKKRKSREEKSDEEGEDESEEVSSWSEIEDLD
jgi:hypothetical protein